MTDPTDGAAAPPKRRAFGFKKAAWQTAPKKDEQDMFSHSNEFQDIVAEQAKRQEEKKKAEEAQKQRQKAEEERHRKRRKVSVESDEGVQARSSSRNHRVTSKGRSKTPMSPTRNNSTSETLAARYDSLTKSSSSSVGARTRSQVIDLGDTEDEDEYPRNPSPSPRAIPIHSRPQSERESSEEVEEVDSPHIAVLKAQIRAKASAKSPDADQAPTASSSAQAPMPVAIVQLLIESDIPDTKPLMVKIKTDASLAKPKEAWCTRQGFTPAQTRAIFMTWKGRRIFDYTKIQRLGIRLENGYVSVEGDPNIYDDENLPRIHVAAWTEEVYKARKEADALEAAAAAQAAKVVNEPEPEAEPEPEVKQIKLVLKAKGREDFKLKVNPHTEVSHMASAYKMAMKIPKEQPVTLMFDGDRLKPMDTVADIDVDDMDAIEVHFK
ncbi:uncharacterized protein CC84DRAFT_1129363 [Paraphaeosphaeria sporulosa]|uniref:Ubiquitin-like domain-containing protein n=1 Tax=Paraphaeosphaeria sporulosa TaxID=1460663 RepID=A0A177C1F9_9PLEO|nr:uncharacterized protein CC84DRAFT_1129363 [Paraphaeosphaeria sporulosa]OAG00557.1 hypothetical protein CC84DRAFT_1129363 [Paraphaeosphaeria sporulosa]